MENIRQFFTEQGDAGSAGPGAKPEARSQSGTVAKNAEPEAGNRNRQQKKVGPGSTIEHAKYGRGTVLRLEGSGEDTKVTVSFPGYGLKKLIAKYAGIKIE